MQIREDQKVTWCEILTDLAVSEGHSGGASVAGAEAVRRHGDRLTSSDRRVGPDVGRDLVP